MSLYRARPFAWEEDEDGCWVAPLPTGPIGQLTGAGPVLLAIISAADRPLEVREVADAAREVLRELPEDLERSVASFLEDLVRLSLLEHVG